MFPLRSGQGGLPPLTLHPKQLEALAALMTERPHAAQPDSTIPAGYTFLGQFIDHDLTFDTSSRLGRPYRSPRLDNARTPDLDLDNVYGGGPDISPHLYNLPYLRAGRPLAPGRFDLLRLARGKQYGPLGGGPAAVIGDPRDDENLIISQLHAAFTAFHNAVASEIIELRFGGGPRKPCAGATGKACPAALIAETLTPGDRRAIFEDARDHTIHFYHRVIAEDYLPRIIGTERALDLFRAGRDFYFPYGFRQRDGAILRPYIPVEFAAAGFRFGHSQVKQSYRLNARVRRNLFASAAERRRGGGLRSLEPVAPENVVAWRYFFPVERKPPPGFNWSRPIDRWITQSLHELDRVGGVPRGELGSLPARNLIRGNGYRLPSGQDIAAFILPVLEQRGTLAIWDKAFPNGRRLGWRRFLLRPERETVRALGTEQLPLWYYVLYEAEVFGVSPVLRHPKNLHLSASSGGVPGGETLGPVGGTIVGEVLTGLLEHYRVSTGKGLDYDPFAAGAEKPGGRYTMRDFLIAAGVAD